MKLWPRRTKTDKESAVIVDPEDQEKRLSEANRALEASKNAVAKVHASVPRVDAHTRSMARVAADNGLAAIILSGFRKGQAR